MVDDVVRFRPLIMQERRTPEPGEKRGVLVYPIFDGSDGLAVLRTFDWPVPLRVPLDRVTVADLPPTYRQAEIDAVIGPPEEVTGPEEDVLDHVYERIAELTAQASRGVGVSAHRTELPPRRGSAASSPSGSPAEQR